MKSGQLTSLSATAYRCDVRVVRLRAKRRPPPRICPLLISPRPGISAALTRPLFGRAEFRWEFLVSRSAKFFGLSWNLRNKIFRRKMKTECCLNLGEGFALLLFAVASVGATMARTREAGNSRARMACHGEKKQRKALPQIPVQAKYSY